MLTFRLNHRRTRGLMAVAWAIAITVSAWVAAELLTRVVAPPRIASSLDRVADPRIAAQRIAGRSLIADAQEAVSAATRPAAVRQRFALVGVATGFGDAAGFALLRSADGQVVAAQVGESIAPGVTLSAIHADHVELEQGGARELVRLTVVSEAAPPPPTSMLPNPTNQR